MERILSRMWLVLSVGTVAMVVLACGVSLAAAQDFDGPGEGPLQYADGPEIADGPESGGGPEGGDGPQCSPEWLREWYLWEDPDNEEDWWYFWWYKWCQNPNEGDWFKAYGSWEWWAPAGDESVDELLEEWSA